MDKNYWLLIWRVSAEQRRRSKIPAGFEVVLSGTAGVYQFIFRESLSKYYAMVNLDTVTFLDSASL